MLTKVALVDSFAVWCIISQRPVDDVARMVMGCGSAIIEVIDVETEAGA